MESWWAALPLIEKVLWCFAVPASILAVIQVFLEILGMSDHDSGDGFDFGDGDADANFDGHHGGDFIDGVHHSPLNLFTVKGFIIFFAAFGWLGIAGVRAAVHPILAMLLASVVGIICMFIFAWVFSTLAKMSERGNFLIKSTLYKSGKVYLKIPGLRAGKGKINIVAQGSLRELVAVTDGEEIPTGAAIQVIEIIDDQTVLVAKD